VTCFVCEVREVNGTIFYLCKRFSLGGGGVGGKGGGHLKCE